MKARLIALALAALASGPARAAPDGFALHAEAGEGNGIRRAGLGLWLPGWTDLPCQAGCRADQYWLLRGDRWWLPGFRGPYAELWDVSVMPVLRFGGDPARGGRLIVELGLGAHLLSGSQIAHKRFFGSTFQFGERIGMGYVLDAATGRALFVAVEHVSNGGLDDPNNGITFLGVELRTGWR